jgi:DNA-binding NarL/FixJ family response regulator
MTKKQPGSSTSRKRQKGILIVEDEEITRTLFALLIEKERDLAVAGAVTRVEDAIDQLKSKKVDAVILDLSFTAHMSGLALGPKLRMNHPALTILVVTQFEGLYEQCRPWADGYLMKQDSPTRLVASLRDAMKARGSKPTPARSEMASELVSQLKPSEIEILILTAEGLTASQIGARLNLSKSAVDNQTKSIYNKLEWAPGRRNKIELAKFAIQAGLAEPR